MPRLDAPGYMHAQKARHIDLHSCLLTHKSRSGWSGEQLNIPCAAVWALFLFSLSALTLVSHVHTGNGGHCVLLGAVNRLKVSEMIQ